MDRKIKIKTTIKKNYQQTSNKTKHQEQISKKVIQTKYYKNHQQWSRVTKNTQSFITKKIDNHNITRNYFITQ